MWTSSLKNTLPHPVFYPPLLFRLVIEVDAADDDVDDDDDDDDDDEVSPPRPNCGRIMTVSFDYETPYFLLSVLKDIYYFSGV